MGSQIGFADGRVSEEKRIASNSKLGFKGTLKREKSGRRTKHYFKKR